MSEGKIWRAIRDRLSSGKIRLWRNEVGSGLVVRHANPARRQAIMDACIALAAKMGGSAARITYGLGADSGDLIGAEQLTVTSNMVGTTVAIFLSVETKTATGSVRPGQKLWLEFINKFGGRAIIARSLEDAEKQLLTTPRHSCHIQPTETGDTHA